MKLRILYDNQTCLEAFQYGWGFSCVIDERILFDTGESAESLLHNMAQASIQPEQLEAVIISHNHWDHTGGLQKLLKQHPGLTVYGCPGFGREFIEQVTAPGGRMVLSPVFRRIDSQMAVTGEIPGEYKGQAMPEQALVIDTGQGMTLITGCSHPGILEMAGLVRQAASSRPLLRIIGGFHLKDQTPEDIQTLAGRLKMMGIRFAGPTHCSGDTARETFKEIFTDGFMEMAAGKVFEI